MNKIEEIFNKQVLVPALKDLVEFRKSDILEAMKEFGKVCFDAGQKQHWEDCPFNEGELQFTYYSYEDFLKEIENETGN